MSGGADKREEGGEGDEVQDKKRRGTAGRVGKGRGRREEGRGDEWGRKGNMGKGRAKGGEGARRKKGG